MKKTIVLVLALTSSGCATYGPTWSEVSGERYHHTIMNRRPALIEKIDGYSSYAQYPIKVEPGRHEIELGGPAPKWPGGAPLYTITLDLEPCKRYYLNAQFDNPVERKWTPVVDYVESIAGCGVAVANR